jgi:hypothetical protein
MAKALSNGKVAIFSKVNMQWTRDKASERWLGTMDHHTKESGSKACKRAGECYSSQMENLEKECGRKISMLARVTKVHLLLEKLM